MKPRLVVNRSYFLAKHLYKEKRTVVDGLKRKYPKAVLPMPKATFLTEQTLSDEYYLKLSYALFESSKSDKKLNQELVEILKKRAQSAFRWIEHKGRNRDLDVADVYDYLALDDIVLLSSETLFTLSVLDYVGEYFNITWTDDETLKMASLHEAEAQHLSSLYPMMLEDVRTNLYSKYGKAYKEAEQFLMGYVKWLNMKMPEFLSYKQNMRRHGLTNFMLEQLLPEQNMTQAEAILLVGLAKAECGEDALTFEWFNEHIFEVLMSYLMMKRHEEDAKQLFAYYPFNTKAEHKVMSETLRVEAQKTQKAEEEYRKLKRHVDQIKMTIEQQKNKKINELSKELSTALIVQAHQQEELESLKAEIKNLQTQLKSQKSDLLESEVKPEVVIEMEHVSEYESGQLSLEVIEQINTSTILIAGGNPKTVQRLQQFLPDCKYISAKERKRDDFFRNVDHTILLTTQIGHDLSRRIKRSCPDSPQFSIQETNCDVILKKIAEHYQEKHGKNKS